MLGRKENKIVGRVFKTPRCPKPLIPVAKNPKQTYKNVSANTATEIQDNKENVGEKAKERKSSSDAESRAPSEEIFRHCSNHTTGLENETMLRLQIEILRDQIRADITHIHPNRGLALTKSTVYLIFFISKCLKLTDGTKFAALEIYDRFIQKYNDEISLKLREKNVVEIEKTRKKIKRQALLRLLSCIQLASKVYADSKIPYISSLEVQKILHEFGIEYKLDRINTSEVRVMKTLDYKLKYVNTFDIIQCILTCMGLGLNLTRQVFDLSLEALEYLCHFHEEMYALFMKNWKENCGPNERKLFRAIEFNKAIEAAGILAGAVCILKVKNEKHVLSTIGMISGTDLEEFMILATILVGVMIGGIPPPPVPKIDQKTRRLSRWALTGDL